MHVDGRVSPWRCLHKSNVPLARARAGLARRTYHPFRPLELLNATVSELYDSGLSRVDRLAQALRLSSRPRSRAVARAAREAQEPLTHSITRCGSDAERALALLEAAVERLKGCLDFWFTSSPEAEQPWGFFYDTTFGGVLGQTTCTFSNFGNYLYNDHAFHYGYFIHAAAVVPPHRP